MVAIMTALRTVLAAHGLPMALYTDRAHWAVHTPTSGTGPDRRKLTQVGRALPGRGGTSGVASARSVMARTRGWCPARLAALVMLQRG